MARKSALSVKASKEAVTVVKDFTFEAPKTSEVANMLSAFKLDGKKVLIITSETDMNIFKSARNILGVSVVEAKAEVPKEEVKEEVNGDAPSEDKKN